MNTDPPALRGIPSERLLLGGGLVGGGLVWRGPVTIPGRDEAVAAQELRHARACALNDLSGVAETAAQELAVLPLRLDGVLQPLTGKRERARLAVADRVGDGVVDAGDVRRVRDPAPADLKVDVYLRNMKSLSTQVIMPPSVDNRSWKPRKRAMRSPPR